MPHKERQREKGGGTHFSKRPLGTCAAIKGASASMAAATGSVPAAIMTGQFRSLRCTNASMLTLYVSLKTLASTSGVHFSSTWPPPAKPHKAVHLLNILDVPHVPPYITSPQKHHP